jgi:arginine decarboxylase
MMLHGRELLDQTLARARDAAVRLAAIPGLQVLRPEHLAGAGTGLHQLDETKLLIGTAGLAADARDIVERLNRVHGVQPELSGTGHVLCITTIGNTADDVERLIVGFEEVATHVGRRSVDPETGETGLIGDLLAVRPETVLTPREAFFAADEAVPLSAAAGRIAAEAITPYPPGIPLLMPGERFSTDVIDLLRALRNAGNPISASDPTMGLVTVVR